MVTLEKWKERLLDLGKRNKLLNYKDSQISTIEVIYPSPEQIYKKISGDSRSFEFYDIDPFIAQENEKQDFNIDLVIEKAKKDIKNNQIIAIKKDIPCRKVLHSISKKAKESLLEKGINILYMAFGFIKWRESDNSDIWYKAPLILIPVSLKNESAIKPFYVEEYEDEIVTNPTLSYKLANEYHIKLPSITDEQTLTEYFAQINEMISPLKWSIVHEVKIAMFSYLKMNMYLDLKNNEDNMLQNTHIRTLLGIAPAVTAEGEDSIKNEFQTILHNVVDADSSQIEAIKLAKNGKSFVLQGPPGTGKSQTITNIIAECLSDGKKVLFVSEKLAALNIVYNNLRKANLNDFCLELHSHKTNKKEVLIELNRILFKGKSSLTEKISQEKDELLRAKKQLNDYCELLHYCFPKINLSPYQLYSKIASLRNIQEIDYVISNIEMKDNDYLFEAIEILNQYMEYAQTLGYNYATNEWFGYSNYDISYEHTIALKQHLTQGVSLLKNVHDELDKIAQENNFTPESICEAEVAYQLFDALDRNPFFSMQILNKSSLTKVIDELKEMKKASDKVNCLYEVINKKYQDDILKIDSETMLNRFVQRYSSVFRIFKKDYFQDRKVLKLYLKNINERQKHKEIIDLLNNISEVRENINFLESRKPFAYEILGDYYNGRLTDWETILACYQNILSNFDKGMNLSAFFLGLRDKEEAVNKIHLITERIKKLNELIHELESHIYFLGIHFKLSDFDIKKDYINQLIAKFSKCISNFNSLESWIRLCKLLNKAQIHGINDYIDYAIKNNTPLEMFSKLYQLLFYKQWVYYIFRQYGVLGEFNRISQDKNVTVFSEKDKLSFEINKAQIYTKLSSLKPNIEMTAPGSQVSVLIREGEKKRKQMPLRILLSKIPELILTLKPCFLMSPLSVSTYLDANLIKFDVVIFDEASQIFPEDAIGAIYRAKQLIVVGDSKQMPPSNFFMAAMTESDYEEEDYTEDITDFESILDICSTYYTQSRLLWHYRSRAEELISFSNKNFYNGALITFTSSKKKEKYFGIDFYHVPQGIFDRKSKVNQIEAERVADLVFDHFNKFPHRSLGVVAFSQSQQDAIDNVISMRREKNSKYERFFKTDSLEAFFIKNLETVQGDERDTIIFSVGYAKDSTGKFLHNFGPLNRQGGERRLNVAVTRAKINVQMVSSIRCYDIDLSRTKAEGTRLLKEYLDYAENGNIALIKNIVTDCNASPDSEFEVEVYEHLRNAGYLVDMQVGSSGYKIDLAVKHPTKSKYVLAIECDGATYHSFKTARDRDRLRQEVLERLGWKFYRIWSTDWFKNNSVEKERLLEAVKLAIEKDRDDSENGMLNVKPVVTVENFIEMNKTEAPIFKPYEELFVYSYQNKDNYAALLEAIVEKESPVAEDWVMKRTAFMFGREKVTNVVKNQFEHWKTLTKGIEYKNGFMYSSPQKSIELRIPSKGNNPREIKHIALEELASGMEVMIRQNIEIPKDSLYRALTNALGYNRVGDAIDARLNDALSYLVDQGIIANENETIRLRKTL